MDSALASAVSQFANNPTIGGKTLRELLNANPDKFFQNAIPLLKCPEEEPGVTYVLVLLISHGLLLSHLLSDESFSIDELTAVARKLSKVDPDFLLKSVQSVLPDPDQTAESDPAMALLRLRLMDVLESVWEGPRVLPAMLRSALLQSAMMRFLCDQDPRVRSKAALLVGKNHPSVRWVEECLAKGENRITANAVESLWNIDSEGVRTLLWNVLTDPDNRCVGNALFGLYRLGDVDVLEQILLMARDKRDLFRSTAAWVMGRTGDPRFHAPLVNLIRDAPQVKTTAFRALGVFKQTKMRLEALPALKVGTWRNAVSQDRDEFLVTVSQAEQQCVAGLRPTDFIPYREEEAVIHYEIHEVSRTGPLSLAFLLPYCGAADQVHCSLVKAIQAASARRRRTDGWLIARYNSTPVFDKVDSPERVSGILKLGTPVQLAASSPPPIPVVFSFLTDSAQLEAAILALPDPAQLPPLLKCSQIIARTALNLKAPQIVLLAPSPAGAVDPEFLESANRLVSSIKACFHAVSTSVAAADPGILALCQKSGGMYLRCSENQLPELLSDLALGLIGSYRVRLATAPGALKLQVFSEQGCGGFLAG